MRCKLTEKMPATLHVGRIDGYDLRCGQEHCLGEIEFTEQKLAGGAVIAGDGGETRFEQGVGIPEMILECVGSAGHNHGSHLGGVPKASVEGVNRQSRGDSWREADDDGPRSILEKAFHRRNKVKSQHAAEATVLQGGLCPLYQGRVLVDAPDH